MRETKGPSDLADLRLEESRKVHCGTRHHEALGVDYRVMTAALPGGATRA